MFKIAVIVGSLRSESINRRFAHALAKLAEGTLEFQFIELGDVPMYNEDLWQDPPAAVMRLKQSIEACDAVLFVTPEYNRSVPGVLKNAIDVGSRPNGKSVWGGKPGAIIGTSVGAIGTAIAQSHLRGVCAYLDIVLMNQPEMYIKHDEKRIDASGNIVSEDTRKYL